MRRRALTAAAVAGNAAVIAVAAFAISRVLQVSSNDLNVLLWLVAGALIHDMIVLPLYTVSDIAFRLGIADHPLRRVRVVNHVRGPAIVSLVLFLVYAPTILNRNPGAFERLSARPQATDPLMAWLWITVGLFALSGLVLAVRLVRDRRNAGAHAGD